MELPQETIRGLVERQIPFVERSGLKVIELQRGKVRLTMPLTGNENHIGTMYAGALFTLAEIPGGALFLTTFDVSRFYPVIKEMSVRFRRPARTAITVEMGLSEEDARRIQQEAEAHGKADYVLEGELKDAHGEVVALSRGVYQIRVSGT